MTREEVINAARAALEEATRSETSVCYLTSEDKEWLEMAIKALEQKPYILQEPKVDFDELKRKILAEVDGGTDDKWLRYGDVCDRISDSIDKYRESEGWE